MLRQRACVGQSIASWRPQWRSWLLQHRCPADGGLGQQRHRSNRSFPTGHAQSREPAFRDFRMMLSLLDNSDLEFTNGSRHTGPRHGTAFYCPADTNLAAPRTIRVGIGLACSSVQASHALVVASSGSQPRGHPEDLLPKRRRKLVRTRVRVGHRHARHADLVGNCLKRDTGHIDTTPRFAPDIRTPRYARGSRRCPRRAEAAKKTAKDRTGSMPVSFASGPPTTVGAPAPPPLRSLVTLSSGSATFRDV